VTTTTALNGRQTRPSALRSFATSVWGWALLALIVVTALAVGSVRATAPSTSGRIGYLESVIKCPTCDNLSIAQSSAPVAVALRHEVRSLVDAGWSTPRIETRIEAQYGSDELLAPSGGVIWIIPAVVVGLGALAIGGVFARTRRLRRGPSTGDDERLVRQALDGLLGDP